MSNDAEERSALPPVGLTMEVNRTEKSMSNPNQEDNQNQQRQRGQQDQGGQQGGRNNRAKVASSRAGRTSPVGNLGE
jgi:hypothetical protein